MLNFPRLKTLQHINFNFNYNNNRKVESFSGKGNSGFIGFSNPWQIKPGDLSKKDLLVNVKNDLRIPRPAPELKPGSKKIRRRLRISPPCVL